MSSEEDDEQDDDNCDDLEGEDYVISHPEPQDDEEAEEELNLSDCIQEALNNDYALDILKCMIAREVYITFSLISYNFWQNKWAIPHNSPC